MNRVHRVIADRIRGELEDLSRGKERALQRWSYSLTHPEEQEAYLESTALNLQSFYTGLERIFSLVAEGLDEKPPTGEAWHRDLLRQMTENVPETRPAVLTPETALLLDEVMRFRHLVRNIYAEKLLPGEMRAMMESLPELWDRLQQELSAFLGFLESQDLGC